MLGPCGVLALALLPHKPSSWVESRSLLPKLIPMVSQLSSIPLSFTRFLLILGCFVSLVACNSKKNSTLPTEFIETWITNHPKYSGLYFKIEKDGFAFSTAEGTVKSYSLTKYEISEATEKKRKTVFHVLHGNRDGQELKVTFRYEEAGGGAISFKNQANIIWIREGTAPQ